MTKCTSGDREEEITRLVSVAVLTVSTEVAGVVLDLLIFFSLSINLVGVFCVLVCIDVAFKVTLALVFLSKLLSFEDGALSESSDSRL